MSKLSVVVIGRDDDYGVGFMDRLKASLEVTSANLEMAGLDYEYVLVDFFPKGKFLHESPLLRDFVVRSNVSCVIVDSSIATLEGLNANAFYEYFAKNVGVRHASGEWLMVLNSDILLSREFAFEVKALIADESSDVYYRPQFRVEVNLEDLTHWEDSLKLPVKLDVNKHEKRMYVQDLTKGSEEGLLTPYSGDFFLSPTRVFVELGRAYDETNSEHRGHLHQASMDGELLFNLRKHGATQRVITSPYAHIFHGHPNKRDRAYNRNGYENKSNWGFVDYKKESVAERVWKVFA